MNIEGITPKPMREAAELSPSKKQDESKLKEACEQFESLFLSQMLKEMKKSVPKAEDANKEQDTYDEMMYDEIAKSMAASGGVGMANILYQQVKDLM